MRERLAKQGGVEVTSSSAKELDQMIKADSERFADLFAKIGIGAK